MKDARRKREHVERDVFRKRQFFRKNPGKSPEWETRFNFSCEILIMPYK